MGCAILSIAFCILMVLHGDESYIRFCYGWCDRWERRWLLDFIMHTFEEIRLSLAIFANDYVDVWAKVVDDLMLVGFEVFEGDEVHC